MSELIIRPIDIEKDAERLADMWNTSDLQWPGSWTDGVPYTAEQVCAHHEAGRMLVVFVAEIEDHIVGYCSFMEDGRHPGEGYLALLNVDPRFQKRSIGRKLIQATIDRAVQEGWKRQTLGTWPANFKAVPTYKKTGHFWTPESSVWMQNFVPGALQMSLAKPFFARHDWYGCYVRELEQTHDVQEWEGLKVFTQHWEAEGEALTIWIDREARAPVAVETDALQIAAIASDIEPLAGTEVDLRWRLINKGDAPVRVYLHAMGDKGIAIDHRDAFDVPAGETIERTASVRVAHDAPPAKDDGTAPAVKSILRLNDDEIELFSGMRVRQPLRVDTAPNDILVQPGRTRDINLQLHSELDEPVTVTLSMVPPKGLSLDWLHKQVTIPAKGHISVPLAIIASDEAVYSIPLRLDRKGKGDIEPVKYTIEVFSLDAGGMLVHRAGNDLRVETDTMSWRINAKEATLKVENVALRHGVLSLTPSFGPPYWPSEFHNASFDLEHEMCAGRVVVRLSAEAKYSKGLWMHVTYALSPTGLCTVNCMLENRGTETYTKRIHLGLGTADRDAEWMAVPLPQGTVHAKATVYPMVWDDAPRDASQYAEPWMAWEFKGTAAGIAWDDATSQVNVGWRLSMNTVECSIAPGERSRVAAYAVAVTHGNWRDVRRQFATWRGSANEAATVERPVERVTVEPAIVVTTKEHATAALRVDSASSYETRGTLTLHGQDGLTVEPETIEITLLKRGQPLEQTVQLDIPQGQIGLLTGSARLSTELTEATAPIRVLRIGTDSPVDVHESERAGHAIWTIDNGVNQFTVAPGFGPSMVGWQRVGVELLDSHFPTPAGRSWAYPWFGGLHALLLPDNSHCWEGFLHKETLTARAIETHDATGIAWRGVRLCCTPKHRDLRGLEIELDYLTVGQSPVCKHVYRMRNLWGTERQFHVGTNLTCSLGADATDLIGRGPDLIRRPTNWYRELCALPWAALTNPHTGLTLIMVGQQGDVTLIDQGQCGRILGSVKKQRLDGRGVCELTYYLAVADSWEAAQAYLALQG